MGRSPSLHRRTAASGSAPRVAPPSPASIPVAYATFEEWCKDVCNGDVQLAYDVLNMAAQVIVARYGEKALVGGNAFE